DPIPEAAVQAAEQAAAEAEEKARSEAASTLKAVVRAYRQGEKAYRAGLLEAGRVADLYLAPRVALGHKRAPAGQAARGPAGALAESRGGGDPPGRLLPQLPATVRGAGPQGRCALWPLPGLLLSARGATAQGHAAGAVVPAAGPGGSGQGPVRQGHRGRPE